MLASSVDSSMAQSDRKHYNKHNYSHYVKKKEMHILSKSENTNLFI